jgi:hypothetical protein
MRPNTLREAFDRVAGGEPPARPLAEFLDVFYGLRGRQQRLRALAEPPPLTGDARLDALAGAAAEYLAKSSSAYIPGWCGKPERYLKEPWFTVDDPQPGMIEFLVHSSPAEFRSRNIFTEERPLRRASQAARHG